MGAWVGKWAMKMKLLNCLVVLVFLVFVPYSCAARISLRKKVQVEKHLRRLNKVPHESIKVSLRLVFWCMFVCRYVCVGY